MCIANRLTSLSQQMMNKKPGRNSILEYLHLNSLLTPEEESIRKKIVEVMIQTTQPCQIEQQKQGEANIQIQKQFIDNFQQKSIAQISDIHRYSLCLKGCVFMEMARFNMEIAIQQFEQIALAYNTIILVGNVEQQKKYQPSLVSNKMNIDIKNMDIKYKNKAWCIPDSSQKCYFQNLENKYQLTGDVQLYSSQQVNHFFIWFSNKEDASLLYGFIIPINQIQVNNIKIEKTEEFGNILYKYTIKFEKLVIPKENKIYFGNTVRDFYDYVFKQSFLLFAWLTLGNIISFYELINTLVDNQKEKQIQNEIKWSISELLTLLYRLSSLLEKNDIQSKQMREFQQYFGQRVDQISEQLSKLLIKIKESELERINKKNKILQILKKQYFQL